MNRTGSPFSAGETCLLVDDRGKHYLIDLDPSKQFHSDRGVLPHSDIIGVGEGSAIHTSKDAAFIAIRPRLADYVLKMKRGAAVLYPKDAGAIVTWADIAPGCTVLEAGTGSGALTLALSRAVGAEGSVVSVERREDHATHARRLIERFAGTVPNNVDLRVGDVEDSVREVAPDRIVLDLPEPATVVPPAADFMAGGGLIASYVPNVPQVQEFRAALEDTRQFMELETFEVMMRSWAFGGRSVRPDHRMVGHTGFITVARKKL